MAFGALFMCLLVLCSGGNVSTHFSVEGVSREGWLLGFNWSSKYRRKRKNSYDVHRYRSDFNKNLIPIALVKAIGDVFIHPFIASIFSQHHLVWRTCTYCCSFPEMVLNTFMFLVSPRSDHWTAIFLTRILL